MAFINDYTESYNPVARDDERGIVLRRIPPGPDPIYPFILEWHGSEIKFAGEKQKERFQDENGVWTFNYDWEIISLTIPEDFKEDLDTIKDVIRDALTCFGEGFNNDRVKSVTVAFKERAMQARGYN